MRDQCYLIRLSIFLPISSKLVSEELKQPLLAAQVATSAAAPGLPRQNVQQSKLTLAPHFPSHFYNFSRHPDVSSHF